LQVTAQVVVKPRGDGCGYDRNYDNFLDWHGWFTLCCLRGTWTCLRLLSEVTGLKQKVR
jgi:hypothetical protein